MYASQCHLCFRLFCQIISIKSSNFLYYLVKSKYLERIFFWCSKIICIVFPLFGNRYHNKYGIVCQHCLCSSWMDSQHSLATERWLHFTNLQMLINNGDMTFGGCCTMHDVFSSGFLSVHLPCPVLLLFHFFASQPYPHSFNPSFALSLSCSSFPFSAAINS